jgi:hypothetical protein
VLPVVAEDIRRSLGDESVPLAWIMPPGSDYFEYGTHNRDVRELQRRAQRESSSIDLILPGAEHIPMSGQPADEALLASRCRQWVLGTFFGAGGPASGPLFDRLTHKDEVGTIHFKPGTAAGLSATGDALKHFEAAGPDGTFYPCDAEIDGETVALTSGDVDQIVYVRYGFTRKPVQGLVNSSGLPAVPFTTDPKWEYDWWPAGPRGILPDEYRTTANEWPGRDIAIVNPRNKLAGRADSQPDPSRIGPTGILAAQFGPNLYVHDIVSGSPADGKLLKHDIIYGVNGVPFGREDDDKYHQMSAAITLAESEAGAGKMTLNVRRKGKLVPVPIELEVLGSYSATSPWNCKKSKAIVKKAEQWMRAGLRPEKGLPSTASRRQGHLHTNNLFLLADGNPELQGLVRRYVREVGKGVDPNEEVESGSAYFQPAYMCMFLGEYYHRTGDPYVLPYMQKLVEKISLAQIAPPDGNPYLHVLAKSDEQVGGFRGGRRTPGTKMVARKNPPWGRTDYGLMVAADMVAVMGLQLAKEAGLKVDEDVLRKAIRHLHYKRAEHAYVQYAYSNLRRERVPPINPTAEARGLISSMNGKLGTAAALFSLIDGYGATVDINARHCVYAYNRTRSGHGGMFFNNFWTPIGALHSGKHGYQHFMRGQTWWRELYRDFGGAQWQAGRGYYSGDGLGVSYCIHLVAHHHRLRILGAPRSAFGPYAPEYLKDAVAAHRRRDYARAEQLIQNVRKERDIPSREQPIVDHFLESVRVLKESIDYDLAHTADLIKDGRYYHASLELPQLKGVVAPDDPRLVAIAAALESNDGQAKIAAQLAQARGPAVGRSSGKRSRAEAKRAFAEMRKPWVPLVKDGMKIGFSRRNPMPSYPEDEWNHWRMRILETPKHAPDGWHEPDYDDSPWDEITLPISWRVGHTALLRTTFTVDDPQAYNGLQVHAKTYKQRNMLVYLNGQLVAKVNNMGAQASFKLTPSALEVLKRGENSLAVITQHTKRLVAFGFRLEGHLSSHQLPTDDDEKNDDEKKKEKEEKYETGT